MSSKKMTVLQFSFIYILSVASISTFYSPYYLTEYVGSAGWIVPLIMVVPSLLFFFMYESMFKNDVGMSYSDKLCLAYGRGLGTALSAVYALWILALCVIKLSVFVNRIVSNAFYYLPFTFCVGAMLVAVLVCLWGGADVLGRTAQIFFIVFGGLVAVIIILAVQHINLINLTPVTVYDVPSGLEASIFPLSTLSYLTYFAFFADRVRGMGSFRRYGVFAALSGCVFPLLIFVLNVGSFSSDVVRKLVFPFFSLLKNASQFGSIQHFEAVIISAWVITDFVLISSLLMSVQSIVRQSFRIREKSEKLTSAVLVSVVFAGCVFIGRGQFDLERVNAEVVTGVNAVLGVGAPIVTYIILLVKSAVKRRKRISV